MDFSSALVALRVGIPMHRQHFVAGTAVYFVPATGDLLEHFQLRGPTGPASPWLPSLQDLLATDWDKLSSKPPTQGVVAQGFEAFGPMGANK